MGKLKAVTGGLLMAIFGPPKDDSSDAALSGDIDEMEEPEADKSVKGERVIVEEAGDDD